MPKDIIIIGLKKKNLSSSEYIKLKKQKARKMAVDYLKMQPKTIKYDKRKLNMENNLTSVFDGTGYTTTKIVSGNTFIDPSNNNNKSIYYGL